MASCKQCNQGIKFIVSSTIARFPSNILNLHVFPDELHPPLWQPPVTYASLVPIRFKD